MPGKNDIGLIRVMQQFELGPNVRPACLHTSKADLHPDVELIIAGWGVTEDGCMQFLI